MRTSNHSFLISVYYVGLQLFLIFFLVSFCCRLFLRFAFRLTDAVAVKNGVVAGNGLRCGQLQAIFPRGFVVLLGLIDLFAVFCLADERCRAGIALHFGKLLLDFLKLRQVFLPTARTDGKKQNEGKKK